MAAPSDIIEAIASNRTAGASQLLAELLPVLDERRAGGRAAMHQAIRRVCLGQPAMAPLWNACAAALADVEHPGRFDRVRREMLRAPQALARAAMFALDHALAGVDHPTLLTVSYSGSVAAALRRLAGERALEVVCAESLPGREGARLHDDLSAAGLTARLVLDAEITTYLPGATAVVVGADAISARDWTNKAGTFGLAAAASYAAVPVYVVASRDKVQGEALRQRMSVPRAFERTPVELATLFLTEAGPMGPGALPQVTERFAADLEHLFEIL